MVLSLRQGRSRRAAWSPGVGVLFVLPALGFFAVFIGFPLVRSLYLSLTAWPGFGPTAFTGGANYARLLADPVFLTALRVTLIYTLVATVLQTAVPMAIAILLNAGWRGGIAFRTLLFVPAVVSLTVSGIIWNLVLSPQGGPLDLALGSAGLKSLALPWLSDTATALPAIIVVSLWQATGVYMLIFYAGLQGIDETLYESARIDGASRWQQVRHLTVPLLRPMIGVVVTLNVIHGLKVFDLMFVMTGGGPDHATETLATYLYSLSFGSATGGLPEFGYAAAIGFVIFVLGLILTAFLTRFRQSAGDAT
ncbi:MAG: carbohydrate ABC transporter permease [Candidatus Dormibacteraceae bacterium]